MAEERNRPPQKPETENDPDFLSTHQDQGASQGEYEPNRRPDAGDVSRSMIAGWVALGVLLGIFSLIIVFFLYGKRDADVRSQAIRFSLVGIGVGLILQILLLQYMTGGASVSASAGGNWTSSIF